MIAESNKKLWRPTAAGAAPIGTFIGTKNAEPVCVDPIVAQNEDEFVEREYEHARAILSSPLRPRSVSPGGSMSSGDESLQWMPTTAAAVGSGALSRSPSASPPPPPRQRDDRPSSPPTSSVPLPKNHRPMFAHVVEDSAMPISVAAARTSSSDWDDPSPPAHTPAAAASAAAVSPDGRTGDKGAYMEGQQSPLSRQLTRASTFTVVVTAEDAHRATLEALNRFESLVKPLTDEQYLRSIRREEGVVEAKKKRRKKKKPRSADAEPRQANEQLTQRLKPVNLEAILLSKDNRTMSYMESFSEAPPKLPRRMSSLYLNSMQEEVLKPIEEVTTERVEQIWMKKVRYTLSDDKRVINRSSSNLGRSKANKFEQLADDNADAARVVADNKRILSRQTFGTCRVEDLLQLREAFLDIVRSNLLKEAQMSLKQHSDEPIPDFSGVSFNVGQYVGLFDLMSCKYISARKGHKYQMKKYVESMELSGKIKEFINMSTIIKQLFPLMPVSDHRDCLKYFTLKENMVVEEEDTEPSMTVEELRKLREMFDFFDSDRSGFVDPKEIMDKMKRNDVMNVNDTEDSYNNKDVEDNHIIKLIQAVDEDENAELDFDEFCKLFRGAF